jgi:hypothetical protein
MVDHPCKLIARDFHPLRAAPLGRPSRPSPRATTALEPAQQDLRCLEQMAMGAGRHIWRSGRSRRAVRMGGAPLLAEVSIDARSSKAPDRDRGGEQRLHTRNGRQPMTHVLAEGTSHQLASWAWRPRRQGPTPASKGPLTDFSRTVAEMRARALASNPPPCPWAGHRPFMECALMSWPATHPVRRRRSWRLSASVDPIESLPQSPRLPRVR